MAGDERDLATIASFYRRLQWAAVSVGVLWVVWLLAPILTPFAMAALLGWLGDPLVDKLERKGLKRNTAVILVFGVMTTVLAIASPPGNDPNHLCRPLNRSSPIRWVVSRFPISMNIGIASSG